MIPKLVIDGIEVPITKELPVSVNLAISDVRNFDKGTGSFTKSIVLEGSQEVDKIFEFIFRVNKELATFDPNAAIEAIYYINEKKQLKGDLQLLRVTHKGNGSVEYTCNIIGREGGFFVAVGDALLTDLDFSDFDHPFNMTNIVDSWATSYIKLGVPFPFAYGEGYTFPFINYGYTSSNTTLDVNHFKPAIAAKEYMTRIFAAAGYTWDSNFLDGTFFSHLYIPCNKDRIQLDSADIDNSQYFVGKTATAPTTYLNGNTSGSNAVLGAQTINPNYDLETAPYFDPSNIWSSGTYQATVGYNGVYNIVAFAQIELTVDSVSLPGGSWTSSTSATVTVIIEVNYGSGWVVMASVANPIASTNQLLGTAKVFKGSAQTGNINLNATDLIRVRTVYTIGNTALYNSLSVPASNNTPFTSTYILPNGTQKNEHYLLRTDPTLTDGNTIAMNNAIPSNIKQRDFVKWIFQMFKLNAEIDPNNDKVLIIEPEVSGWYSGTVDWTAKVDYSKDWEMRPMGELDSRNYVFKYKDDKDYYNDIYQKGYIDNYGLKRLQVNNDFLKNEKKIEIGFSPTPLVGNSSNNIICPHIYQKDGTNLKPLSHNIRILYYDGLKNSGNAWNFTSGSTSVPFTQYPYIGHFDDPYTPTLDLNFDNPMEVYFTYLLAYYPTAGLFNVYYSQYMNEIIDPDSKIITCWVNLNPIDIMQFTFRKKVYIDNPKVGSGYYVVNKIIDYNPNESLSTKVELLKTKPASPYVAGAIPIDPSYDPADTARVAYNPLVNTNVNSENTNSLALGNSNRIMGDGNIAVGSERCFVDETSSGVTLINCTEVSVVGGTNITVIGVSNKSYDSGNDGQTINRTTVVNSEIKTQEVSADFSIDEDTELYYVDCSGGDVTATLDLTTVTLGDRVVGFTRVDNSANTFYIDDPSGTVTVMGNATPYDTGMIQYESIDITLKNNIIYIKG